MSFFRMNNDISGLLGNPQLPGMDGIEQALMQNQQAQKPGFFSQGGTGQNIAGYIGDALMQMGGMQPAYGPTMERRRLMQEQTGLYEKKRADEMQDFYAKKQWERDNPPPQPKTMTERLMDEFLDPNTPPERKAIIKPLLSRPVGVTVRNQDGSEEIKYMYPDTLPGLQGSGGGEDEWEYLPDEGGAGPQTPPMFPRPY